MKPLVLHPLSGAAALVLLAGAVPSGAQAQQLPGKAEMEAAVDSIVAASRARMPTPGLTVAVVRGRDTLVMKGYGQADVELGVAATPETVYRIGSVTKQFTAAAVMRLVEQGKLSLDDPITEYLPDFPTQGHTVTVRHLLDHTSGIKSYTSLGKKWMKVLPLELTHEELLDLFEDEPFDFAPGEKWAYNNSGYYLLGMIIEKVTGKSYGEHLEEMLFQPLGLASTMYCSESRIIPNRAEGYTLEDGELRNDAPIGMNQPGAAGALCSTAPDLLRWQAALESGKVVSAASYRAMTTPATLANGEPTTYGFGLRIGEVEGHREVAHGGGIPGFSTWLGRYPDDSLSVLVLINSDVASTGPIVKAVTRRALGLPVEEVKDVAIDAAELVRYFGVYALGPLQLRIFEEGGKLTGQATGQGPIQLLYQGEHAFVAALDHGIRLVFDIQDGRATGLTLYQGGAVVPAKRMQ